MGELFRYIDCGAQDPFEANSRMIVLAKAVAHGAGPTFTTSVWGATHLNVGWFDDVDSTLDLARCAELGMLVIRRPSYGGGTAFYEEGSSAMWSWLLPTASYPDLNAELERFQPVFMDALHRVGINDVQYEGSSDLRWHGRKLGALVGQDIVVANSVGGFINIRPPNLELYLQVVRVPDDKFKDKAVKDMREYVVNAEEIRGRPLPYEELRDALVASCRTAGLELRPGPFTDEEEAGIAKGARRISDDAYVRRVSSERFRAQADHGWQVGFGNEKGRKLCRAGVAVNGDGVVAAAMMAGDMHVSPPDTMDRVAEALVGADASDRNDLRARIAGVFEGPDVHQADEQLGVTTDDLLTAVRKAVAQAQEP